MNTSNTYTICEVDGCTKLTWYAFKCQEHALATAAKAPAPSPEKPAADPKAWQTIANFIDKYRMLGAPTGAQVVAKLQEKSR